MTFVKRAIRSMPGLDDPDVPLTEGVLASWFGGMKSRSGTNVSEQRALTLSAVWRSVNLLSNLTGALPFNAIDDSYTRVKSILDNPHPMYTTSEWLRIMTTHAALYGDGIALKIRDKGSRRIIRMPIVHPESVMVWKYPGDGDMPEGRAYRLTMESGEQSPILLEHDVFHVMGFTIDGIRGIPPIRKAMFESMGLSLAAEEHGSRFFGNSGQMQGFLSTESGTTSLADGDIKKIKQRWRSLAGVGNAYDIALLEGGVKFNQLSIPNDQAQFLQTRSFQIEEVARWFGIPPFLLMHTEKSTSWGTGLEQQATGFTTFDLVPGWLKPFEDRCTLDLLDEVSKARFDTSWLMRGDSQSRAFFYRVMREIGAWNADDVRRREYEPPIPDGKGQIYLQPTNLAPLGWSPSSGTTGAP